MIPSQILPVQIAWSALVTREASTPGVPQMVPVLIQIQWATHVVTETSLAKKNDAAHLSFDRSPPFCGRLEA